METGTIGLPKGQWYWLGRGNTEGSQNIVGSTNIMCAAKYHRVLKINNIVSTERTTESKLDDTGRDGLSK